MAQNLVDVDMEALDFSNPVLQSGTAEQPGAIYRYDDIVTVASVSGFTGDVTVNATIEIVDIVSADLVEFDDTANPERFEPRIVGIGPSGGYVEFRLSFFAEDESGAPEASVNLENFFFTSIDVDGPDDEDWAEFQEVAGISSYTVDTSTQLTVTPGFQDGLFVLGTPVNYSGISFNDAAALIGSFAEPVTTLDFRLGTTGDSNGTARLYSVSVSGVPAGSFSNPVETFAPAASLEGPTTYETEPVEVTVTFSEIVEGLTESDFEVTNGSIEPGSLSTSDGITYTFNLVPPTSPDVYFMDIVLPATTTVSAETSLANTVSNTLLMVLDLCEGDDSTGNDDGDDFCNDTDQCIGDDLTGDADADGVCDDLDVCDGDDAVGDSDGDDVCEDIDICLGNDASGDSDNDDICDDLDVCLGDDLSGDSDGDTVCDNIDACEGDDFSGDSDGDNVCDNIDACEGNDASGDSDGDDVCDNIDACEGDDASGDSDGDNVCDNIDACEGDDASGDSDGDDVCDNIDACEGDDASGDSDGDDVCDNIDACEGDDASGDADGDDLCDDVDTCFGDNSTGDSDGDEICDDEDLCLGDDSTGDSDGDGLCLDTETDIGTDDEDNDSDDDGLSDGDEYLGTGPLEPFGPTDPTNPDSDDDGIQDGTEVGETDGQSGTDSSIFIPDADPTTTTDPNDEDTDEGGVPDGIEDSNFNGAVDPGELDPNLTEDDDQLDSDGDGLTDLEEDPNDNGVIDPGETDPFDADSDDDGLSDGDEVNGTGPLAPFGPTDPNNPDSDDDGIQDGTEVGVTDGHPTDTDTDIFVPDADSTTTTDPNDDDTDDDGLMDGTEDANGNGAVDVILGGTGTEGSGESDPNNEDSDADGLQDGTESGLDAPEGQDTDPAIFIPDADPSTTTNPVDSDTDDGGIGDGDEDENGNGLVDLGERDPLFGDDDLVDIDTDGDGIPDIEEDPNDNGIVDPGETDPFDADTDDDGISDGDEVNGFGPLAPYGPTDPTNPDTDGDGLTDGTEVGVTDGHPTDTDTDIFVPDADPSTTTDPNDDDTDDDCLLDGYEDENQNGAVDEGELDPNDQDMDDDGLSDGVEVGVSGPQGDSSGECEGDADPSTTTDPFNEDSDDDGIDDGTEDGDGDGSVGEDETDPNNEDSDGDSISDGDEDTNGNGVVDPGETNPREGDSDGDGIPDEIEIGINTDPTLPFKLQGSGCQCNSAGGPAPGGMPLLAGLTALLVGLRRRKTAALTAAALTVSSTALAQDETAPQLDVQRFDPHPQTSPFTRIADGQAAEKGSFSALVTLSYGLRPLEIGSGNTYARETGVIDHLFGVHLTAAYAPLKWLEFGVDMAALQISGLADNGDIYVDAMGGNGNTLGIGDLSLAVNMTPIRQGDNGKVSLAFIPRFIFPTGTRNQFLGSGSFSAGADVALAHQFKSARLNATVGYQFNAASSAVLNIHPDDEFRYGLGVAIPLKQNIWDLIFEYNGALVVAAEAPQTLGDAYDALNHAPMEIVGAVQYVSPKIPFAFKAGVGPGLTSGFGTPDVRAFLQVGSARYRKPEQDFDKDGLVDSLDQCPQDPEDQDQFQDGDGCPDLDNDMDGIVDVADDCPMTPEDKDTFQDEDGCPDEDNDNDGILDVEDGPVDATGFGTCRDVPEDADGFEDADGCADLDNDNDGIPDVSDGARTEDGAVIFAEGYAGFGNCMNQPETINGKEDDDGCPDEALASLDLETREIRIVEKVYFDYDKANVRLESHPVLNAVLDIMLTYPEIGPIEIQGHTDSRGSDEYNRYLSQQRVDAVRAYLIERGVEADRLTAVGYGESQPIKPGARTEEDHQLNRRVQFVITGNAEVEIRVEE